MKKTCLAALLALCAWSGASFAAAEEQPHAAGLGDKDYVDRKSVV